MPEYRFTDEDREVERKAVFDRKMQIIGGDVDDMIEGGNLDVFSRPLMRESDGTVSRGAMKPFQVEGVEFLLPLTDASGKLLSDDEALAQFERTGNHYGGFRTAEEAMEFSRQLGDAGKRWRKPTPSSDGQPGDDPLYLWKQQQADKKDTENQGYLPARETAGEAKAQTQGSGKNLAAQVTKIVDGDTFAANVEVSPGTFMQARVRIRGLYAPEMSFGGSAGPASRKALAELLAQGQIRLTDVQYDRHGRIVAGVEVNGQDVAKQMIAGKHATAVETFTPKNWPQGNEWKDIWAIVKRTNPADYEKFKDLARWRRWFGFLGTSSRLKTDDPAYQRFKSLSEEFLEKYVLPYRGTKGKRSDLQELEHGWFA